MTIFDAFCPAQKMLRSVENIFDTFWRFWRGPFPLAPFAVHWFEAIFSARKSGNFLDTLGWFHNGSPLPNIPTLFFPREMPEISGNSAFPIKEYTILPALLQKLVGELFFLNFWEGNLAGSLAGILRDFSDPQNKGSKFSGKILEHFSFVATSFCRLATLIYYQARNDYTNNSETILSCNRCACNRKINSQTISVCNWYIHRKYLIEAPNYTKEFLPESPV